MTFNSLLEFYQAVLFNDFTKTLNIAPNHKQASEQMISAQVGTYDVIKINNHMHSTLLAGLIVQNL